MNNKFLFLDTETTGLKNPRMIQLAYSTNDQPLVNLRYKPPIPIELMAMATHHITEEMVKDQLTFENSIQKNLLQELLDQSVMIAHNAQFDMMVLKNEGVRVKSWICTQRLAMYLYDLESYKLQYLRYHFGCKFGDQNIRAHDAEGDIIVLREVFICLYNDFIKMSGLSEPKKIIDAIRAISERPGKIRKFTFGKYRGKYLAEVMKEDRGYIDWLIKEELKKDEEDINTDLLWNLQNIDNKTISVL